MKHTMNTQRMKIEIVTQLFGDHALCRKKILIQRVMRSGLRKGTVMETEHAKPQAALGGGLLRYQSRASILPLAGQHLFDFKWSGSQSSLLGEQTRRH